ncbi:MAG: hypothetical protein K6T51_03665 [Rubrobacteraceae bacterium]|nr:hypothetical protein [Rubrobacteraceae bacterium]MCL6437686.1 hypothetical protein [Rubrobacteraceae bacterium]
MVDVRGVAFVAVVALLFLSACSQRSTGEAPGAPGGTSTISASSAAQVTIRTSSAPAATMREGDTASGTTSAPPRKVTLSVEGDRGVKFSGLCESGGKETVISGTVPKLFSYRLQGQGLSCRIQKQGGKGALRVTLLVGNTTRSVQQTSVRKGTIHVSYSGGR